MSSPFIWGPGTAQSLSSGGITLPGSTSGTLQIQPSAATTTYAITMPASQGAANTVPINNGSGVLSWQAVVTALRAPTVQKFLTGSGTYGLTYYFTVSSANATAGATYTNNGQTFTVVNTISASTTLVCTSTGAPSSSGTLTKATGTGDATITFSATTAPLYIKVKMVGGGGGGGSSGTAALNVGGSGGNTTFGTSLLTANGGSGGGVAAGGAGGAGGTVTTAAGPLITVALQGGTGDGSTGNGTNANFGNVSGGMGAPTPFAGAGVGVGSGASMSAIANTGSGGGGGGTGATTGSLAGAGGGAGGYIEAIITSPVATYAYAIGALGSGGAAGTSGNAGSNGGSGIVIVEEYYQ